MKEETLIIQYAQSTPALSRGKERFISLYLLWSILEISNFLFSYNHLCFAPRTWIRSERGGEQRVRKWCAIQITYTVLALSRILFYTVPLCSFYLDKTELSQNNKWNNNRVTQATWPQTGRDWAHFVVEIRETRQCGTSGPVWSSYATSLHHMHFTYYVKPVWLLPEGSVGKLGISLFACKLAGILKNIMWHTKISAEMQICIQ